MARKPDPGARERILDSAERLFREHGARAVGMQQIVDECGCGKSLVYREFDSKDELVACYLERAQEAWDAEMTAALETVADDPAEQLVALVHAAVREVQADCYEACPFRTTFAQYPDAQHPAHVVAVRHIEGLRAWLRDLAAQAGARDPQALADRLLLVIDGVYVNGAMLGTAGAVTSAVDLAEELVQAATAGA